MQIESFKIEVKTEELDQIAQDVNAIELIESLGLVGQQKLVNHKEQTHVAFRKMTLFEVDVYSLLFPEKSKVEEFETEIIPIRVLSLLKEAKDSEFFIKFEVWHSSTKKEDPILVGVTGKLDPQTWNQHYITDAQHWLIARWGDALLPFDTLREQAKKLWIAKETYDLQNSIQDKQQKLGLLAQEVEVKFSAI